VNLKNNTIVITGGSSGIGLQLAKTLAADNEIIICGRSASKLDEAKQLVPGIHAFQCDLSQADQRRLFAEYLVKNHPRCNMLINNAAIVHHAEFYSDPSIIEKADLEMQTNFMAPLDLTKQLLPLLEKNSGPGDRQSSVIYVTTGLVFAPRSVYPVYCATKAALHSFAQTLRLQLADKPVSVIEVMMPAVDTPWHKGNPPAIAIPVEDAVKEMCAKLAKGGSEIKIAGVNLLYTISRLAPAFALKKINSV
jgi:uncharacterized oxidoreductase